MFVVARLANRLLFMTMAVRLIRVYILALIELGLVC